MRSAILFAAVLGLAVNAQDSSSSSSSTASAASPIPTGVSSSCSSFLSQLNSNASLSSCLSPLISASSSFSPLNASSQASQATIKSTLTSLCSSSTCDSATIRYQLSSMYSACGDDLTSGTDADVVRIYDVLYAILPMRNAVCAKDDSGDYCVLEISSSGVSSAGSKAASDADSAANYYAQIIQNLYSVTSPLSKRGPSDTSLLVPNTTTFTSSGLPFLFLTPSSPSSSLCTSCTRSVITAYTTFEQAAPYALGLDNSPILGGQNKLYDAIEKTCGASFLSGAVNAAGGLSGSIVDSGAREVKASTAAVVGVVGVLGAIVAGL